MKPLRIIKFTLLLLLVSSLVTSMSACTSRLSPVISTLPVSPVADKLMMTGSTQFERGEFAQAVAEWQQAANLYEQSGHLKLAIPALLSVAEAYQRLGHYQEAFSLFPNRVLKLAEQTADKAQLAAVYGSWGQVCMQLAQLEEAKRHLETSIQLATAAHQPALQALALLHLGQVVATQQDYQTAQTHFTHSIDLAQQSDQALLILKGLMNQAWLFLVKGDKPSAQTQLTSLWPQLQRLPKTHETAYLWIKFGEFAQQLGWSRSELQTIFKTVEEIANARHDYCMRSQAWGELGSLSEQAQQYSQALPVTQAALLTAQEHACRFLEYRWHWQLGRLFKVQGELDQAIIAYQNTKLAIQAIVAVQSFSSPQLAKESCVFKPQPDFEKEVKPVFLELANLLLQRAKTRLDNQWRQKDLTEAQQVLEKLKENEIKDYFKDSCVTRLGESMQINDLDESTAVIYPFVFEERLELLLSLPKQESQLFTTAVTVTQLRQTVRDLRLQLEDEKYHESMSYLQPAQQLYHWLIEPLVSTLKAHQTDTLVLVPEEFLRTIPLAVLHDGQQFLIEQYAVAMTTSITLTNPQRHLLTATDIPVLSGWLTDVTPEVKKEFDKLNVSTQSEDILKIYPKQRQLIGKDFTVANLKKALQSPYTLLHISSHAQFAPELKDTFIVTYDAKTLSLDQLEKLIKPHKYSEPREALELLTLDACETAKGDARAALGLAGVALKAGARSTLATLWKVNTEVASHLTRAFYQHQTESRLSKAKALQEAQKKLLSSQFQHPHFWSAFILIGNWL